MKLSKAAFLFFWLCSFTLSAQFSEPEISLSKEERFLYPVKPGQPGSLAGNMGELRTTHFHSGIDVRTDNKIGYPILASKSGYISRVTMSPSGYGNVIYITHPDGYTTLYAHLHNFYPALAEYVLKQQYQRRTFDIDLTFTENEFVVKQGDIIGYSGNTGSSGGPHLHFDIRDPNNQALNPLKFGFSEITDTSPPYVEKVALVTLDANSRINDQFGRFEFYAYRTGNNFVISAPLLAWGNIGIEVLAKDQFVPRGRFYGGVNYIDMLVDGKLQFRQAIEKFDISETRGIYTLMNFKALRNNGTRFYKLYRTDGNTLPFYEASPTSGRITVGKEKESKIEIILSDSFDNKSKLSLRLRPSPPGADVKNLGGPVAEPILSIEENILKLTTRVCSDSIRANLFRDGSASVIAPAYSGKANAIFLVDLRKNFPDSIVVCDQTIVTDFKTIIPSETDYTYFSDDVDMVFPANALYDTLYLQASYRADQHEVFTFGDRTIPLNKNITISIRPQKEYDRTKHIGVYWNSGKSLVYLGGQWTNGRIQFSTRELGEFALLSDSLPPRITPLSVNNHTVRFRIRDDLSGIATYTANINGEWLLMHYDGKSGTLWSERQDKTIPLKGELKLEVSDYAGNTETFTQNIP